MGSAGNHLPTLRVNELFIRDLMGAKPPCFAMGFVEEHGELSGFIALRPEKPIPNQVTQQGMNFGHSVLGSSKHKVLHFGFEFYSHETFHGLVPAGNPVIQSVISTMLDTQDYFFLRLTRIKPLRLSDRNLMPRISQV